MDISKDERELYDRQIRLWGLEGQSRLRNARILVLGFGGTSVETVKNLVLAGVGTLVLQSSESITDEDLAYDFFVRHEDIGKNVAETAKIAVQRLNARVSVSVETRPVDDLPDTFIAEHDVVIATQIAKRVELVRLNKATREANRAFYATILNGWAGFVFADLGSQPHEFAVEREILNSTTSVGKVNSTQEIMSVSAPTRDSGSVTEKLTVREAYSSLEEALNVSGNFGAALKPRQRPKVTPYLPGFLAYLDNNETPDIRAKAEELGLPSSIASDEFIEEFQNGRGLQVSGISAVIGGMLTQEVINFLTLRQYPMQNTLIYDGLRGLGPVFYLSSQAPAL